MKSFRYSQQQPQVEGTVRGRVRPGVERTPQGSRPRLLQIAKTRRGGLVVAVSAENAGVIDSSHGSARANAGATEEPAPREGAARGDPGAFMVDADGVRSEWRWLFLSEETALDQFQDQAAHTVVRRAVRSRIALNLRTVR